MTKKKQSKQKNSGSTRHNAEQQNEQQALFKRLIVNLFTGTIRTTQCLYPKNIQQIIAINSHLSKNKQALIAGFVDGQEQIDPAFLVLLTEFIKLLISNKPLDRPETGVFIKFQDSVMDDPAQLLKVLQFLQQGSDAIFTTLIKKQLRISFSIIFAQYLLFNSEYFDSLINKKLGKELEIIFDFFGYLLNQADEIKSIIAEMGLTTVKFENVLQSIITRLARIACYNEELIEKIKTTFAPSLEDILKENFIFKCQAYINQHAVISCNLPSDISLEDDLEPYTDFFAPELKKLLGYTKRLKLLSSINKDAAANYDVSLDMSLKDDLKLYTIQLNQIRERNQLDFIPEISELYYIIFQKILQTYAALNDILDNLTEHSPDTFSLADFNVLPDDFRKSILHTFLSDDEKAYYEPLSIPQITGFKLQVESYLDRYLDEFMLMHRQYISIPLPQDRILIFTEFSKLYIESAISFPYKFFQTTLMMVLTNINNFHELQPADDYIEHAKIFKNKKSISQFINELFAALKLRFMAMFNETTFELDKPAAELLAIADAPAISSEYDALNDLNLSLASMLQELSLPDLDTNPQQALARDENRQRAEVKQDRRNKERQRAEKNWNQRQKEDKAGSASTSSSSSNTQELNDLKSYHDYYHHIAEAAYWSGKCRYKKAVECINNALQAITTSDKGLYYRALFFRYGYEYQAKNLELLQLNQAWQKLSEEIKAADDDIILQYTFVRSLKLQVEAYQALADKSQLLHQTFSQEALLPQFFSEQTAKLCTNMQLQQEEILQHRVLILEQIVQIWYERTIKTGLQPSVAMTKWLAFQLKKLNTDKTQEVEILFDAIQTFKFEPQIISREASPVEKIAEFTKNYDDEIDEMLNSSAIDEPTLPQATVMVERGDGLTDEILQGLEQAIQKHWLNFNEQNDEFEEDETEDKISETVEEAHKVNEQTSFQELPPAEELNAAEQQDTLQKHHVAVEASTLPLESSAALSSIADKTHQEKNQQVSSKFYYVYGVIYFDEHNRVVYPLNTQHPFARRMQITPSKQLIYPANPRENWVNYSGYVIAAVQRRLVNSLETYISGFYLYENALSPEGKLVANTYEGYFPYDKVYQGLIAPLCMQQFTRSLIMPVYVQPTSVTQFISAELSPPPYHANHHVIQSTSLPQSTAVTHSEKATSAIASIFPTNLSLKQIDVSGYGNNCGLYALALAVRIAITGEPEENWLSLPEAVRHIRTEYVEAGNNAIRVLDEIGTYLRIALISAMQNDEVYRDRRMENFIELCLSDAPDPDMEAFYNSNLQRIKVLKTNLNQAAETAVWYFSRVPVLLDNDQASLAEKVTAQLTQEQIDIASLLEEIYSKKPGLHQLYYVCNLFARVWESEKKTNLIGKNQATSWFLEKATSLYTEETNNKSTVLAGLAQCYQYCGGLKQFKDNVKSLLARFEIKSKWHEFYENYIDYVRSQNVMLSGDELGCLARAWGINLRIKYQEHTCDPVEGFVKTVCLIKSDDYNHWLVSLDHDLTSQHQHTASATMAASSVASSSAQTFAASDSISINDEAKIEYEILVQIDKIAVNNSQHCLEKFKAWVNLWRQREEHFNAKNLSLLMHRLSEQKNIILVKGCYEFLEDLVEHFTLKAHAADTQDLAYVVDALATLQSHLPSYMSDYFLERFINSIDQSTDQEFCLFLHAYAKLNIKIQREQIAKIIKKFLQLHDVNQPKYLVLVLYACHELNSSISPRLVKRVLTKFLEMIHKATLTQCAMLLDVFSLLRIHDVRLEQVVKYIERHQRISIKDALNITSAINQLNLNTPSFIEKLIFQYVTPDLFPTDMKLKDLSAFLADVSVYIILFPFADSLSKVAYTYLLNMLCAAMSKENSELSIHVMHNLKLIEQCCIAYGIPFENPKMRLFYVTERPVIASNFKLEWSEKISSYLSANGVNEIQKQVVEDNGFILDLFITYNNNSFNIQIDDASDYVETTINNSKSCEPTFRNKVRDMLLAQRNIHVIRLSDQELTSLDGEKAIKNYLDAKLASLNLTTPKSPLTATGLFSAPDAQSGSRSKPVVEF